MEIKEQKSCAVQHPRDSHLALQVLCRWLREVVGRMHGCADGVVHLRVINLQ